MAVRTVDDFKALLREGADKISINSSAINTPRLISDAADSLQSVCGCGIDARRRAMEAAGMYTRTEDA